MTEEEVRNLLTRVVPSIDWKEVGLDSSLSEAGLDSLDKVTLIMEYEAATSTKVDDDKYDRLDSIRSLMAPS